MHRLASDSPRVLHPAAEPAAAKLLGLNQANGVFVCPQNPFRARPPAAWSYARASPACSGGRRCGYSTRGKKPASVEQPTQVDPRCSHSLRVIRHENESMRAKEWLRGNRAWCGSANLSYYFPSFLGIPLSIYLSDICGGVTEDNLRCFESKLFTNLGGGGVA